MSSEHIQKVHKAIVIERESAGTATPNNIIVSRERTRMPPSMKYYCSRCCSDGAGMDFKMKAAESIVRSYEECDFSHDCHPLNG